MKAPTASPAFVEALRHQADRIGVDYRPGAGVFDAYTGERLDIPGDMYSFFHALDLPHIAPQHRNWEQVIRMIRGGNLAAPGSRRPIYFYPDALDRMEKEMHASGDDILTNPRRTVDFATGKAINNNPIRVDIHSPRQRK